MIKQLAFISVTTFIRYSVSINIKQSMTENKRSLATGLNKTSICSYTFISPKDGYIRKVDFTDITHKDVFLTGLEDATSYIRNEVLGLISLEEKESNNDWFKNMTTAQKAITVSIS